MPEHGTSVRAEASRRGMAGEPRLSATLPEDLEVVQLATLSLGNRSYLISDGTVAVAVDPQRDIERITT
ncbi:hypothetical protein AB4Z54_71350, partial [Streptomyces sp. MCAF7]